jgi:GT2 family glycosyltransferase
MHESPGSGPKLAAVIAPRPSSLRDDTMSSDMQPLSVIVCTHNPRPEYFRRLIDSLTRQTLPRDEWELLVIDNASDQPLAGVWDLSWHPNARHLREEELGLTAARLRGIKESHGQLIVYVDDDNVITEDYLRLALAIERDNPYITVFGAGALDPEFELPPAAKVQCLMPRLGLRHVDQPCWTNNPEDSGSLPWGAGLCVRRSTAVAYAELLDRLSISHLLDRRGQRLFSGGDDLFSWVAARTGSGFGIFPALRIVHLVRAERVKPPYLLRLVHDHAYSHTILRYVMCGTLQKHLPVAATIRILLYGVRRGMFSMRSHWARARGASAAAKHIEEAGLQPVSSGPFAPSRPGLDAASTTSP